MFESGSRLKSRKLSVRQPRPTHVGMFAHLRGTNPKTSPEQSAIFQLVQEINKTNVLTKFHYDQAKNVTSIVKTAPPPGSHIYKTNLFTKFHDDWAKNVTSRVHVIQLTGTIFQLNSWIKETHVLTRFHEN
ncbi:hypothetical protein DPMN_066954 [Dreissena polymorpha]|uniref:Uncharacterized protein n=1 Tax=Dreissena polymorpha TaxID=45954 RepID=A0A9D3YYV6_DREPO|nr:hypothetical protein DPMN_066954 [Dreissena polymorpha]